MKPIIHGFLGGLGIVWVVGCFALWLVQSSEIQEGKETVKAIENANQNVALMFERFRPSVGDDELLKGILKIVRLELITAYREGYKDGREAGK